MQNERVEAARLFLGLVPTAEELTCQGEIVLCPHCGAAEQHLGLVEHALGHQHHGEAVVSLFFGGQACGHHWTLHFIQRQQHIVVQLDPLMGEEEEDA